MGVNLAQIERERRDGWDKRDGPDLKFEVQDFMPRKTQTLSSLASHARCA